MFQTRSAAVRGTGPSYVSDTWTGPHVCPPLANVGLLILTS